MVLDLEKCIIISMEGKAWSLDVFGLFLCSDPDEAQPTVTSVAENASFLFKTPAVAMPATDACPP